LETTGDSAARIARGRVFTGLVTSARRETLGRSAHRRNGGVVMTIATMPIPVCVDMLPRDGNSSSSQNGGSVMQWTTPSYTDLRFGFEITMYIATR